MICTLWPWANDLNFLSLSVLTREGEMPDPISRALWSLKLTCVECPSQSLVPAAWWPDAHHSWLSPRHPFSSVFLLQQTIGRLSMLNKSCENKNSGQVKGNERRVQGGGVLKRGKNNYCWLCTFDQVVLTLAYCGINRTVNISGLTFLSAET